MIFIMYKKFFSDNSFATEDETFDRNINTKSKNNHNLLKLYDFLIRNGRYLNEINYKTFLKNYLL